MPTDIDLEEPSVFKHIEHRMMSKEDEIVYRLKHGKPPKARLEKECKYDNSKPDGERVYIDYYITNMEQDEK